jgi:hypothetical protein
MFGSTLVDIMINGTDTLPWVSCRKFWRWQASLNPSAKESDVRMFQDIRWVSGIGSKAWEDFGSVCNSEHIWHVDSNWNRHEEKYSSYALAFKWEAWCTHISSTCMSDQTWMKKDLRILKKGEVLRNNVFSPSIAIVVCTLYCDSL